MWWAAPSRRPRYCTRARSGGTWPGATDFEAVLRGRTITGARRRGKYLWLPMADDALLAHLGMSGQLLVGAPDRPVSSHVRVRFTFTDAGPDLRFSDQRTFGHLVWSAGGAELPPLIAHIAPDPLEAALRRRGVPGPAAAAPDRAEAGPARSVPDQRGRQHLRRRGVVAGPAALGPGHRHADPGRGGPGCWREVRAVLLDALKSGGTSFDSLYVNVNGESGYFSRSLVCIRPGG